MQWLSEAVSPGMKRLGREAHHSPPSYAEVPNFGAIPSLSETSSLPFIGQQTLLERPYKKEKKINGSEGNALILVNREKVQIVVGEQTFNIQNHH
jgi:hypothetical protein